MKATLEIPDDLYAMVKARAALEGRTLRSVAIELLGGWIGGGSGAEERGGSGEMNGAGLVVEEAKVAPWVDVFRKEVPQPAIHDLATIRAAIAKGWADERKSLLVVGQSPAISSGIGEEEPSQYNRATSYELDTSVLMRLLVAAPAEQAAIATAFIDRCKVGGSRVHVSNLALAEAYFALQRHYGVRKETALEMLRLFALHSGVECAASALKLLKGANLARANPGFIDRLIHAEARAQRRELVSFEKATAKLDGAKVIG